MLPYVIIIAIGKRVAVSNLHNGHIKTKLIEP